VGGGKQKSADIKQKTVTLIYPDPSVCDPKIFKTAQLFATKTEAYPIRAPYASHCMGRP